MRSIVTCWHVAVISLTAVSTSIAAQPTAPDATSPDFDPHELIVPQLPPADPLAELPASPEQVTCAPGLSLLRRVTGTSTVMVACFDSQQQKIGFEIGYETTPKPRVVNATSYSNNQRNGPFYEFSTDQLLQVQSYYIDGQLSGRYRTWDSAGVLTIDTNYDHGEYDGPLRRWNGNGDLVEEAVYQRGRKNGVARTYSGRQLVSEDFWVAGSRHGVGRTWGDGTEETSHYLDGQREGQVTRIRNKITTSDCTYRADKKHGACNDYFDNGAPKNMRHYIDDAPDGKCLSYTSDSKLVTQKIYLRGNLVDETSYSSNGKLESHISYDDHGKRTGRAFVRTGSFDDFEGTYAAGLRVGLWKYYRNNKIVEQGEFDADQRVGLWWERKDGQDIAHHHVEKGFAEISPWSVGIGESAQVRQTLQVTELHGYAGYALRPTVRHDQSTYQAGDITLGGEFTVGRIDDQRRITAGPTIRIGYAFGDIKTNHRTSLPHYQIYARAGAFAGTESRSLMYGTRLAVGLNYAGLYPALLRRLVKPAQHRDLDSDAATPGFVLAVLFAPLAVVNHLEVVGEINVIDHVPIQSVGLMFGFGI
jgi:antitoxin component YwqK of YwqJK toxin-antitoxin module